MIRFNELYERNKALDQEFLDKYNATESKLYEKNCLELLVELGEFCNETKCFKYWSIKEPNREDMLEEYADCITMILCMFNVYNISGVDVIDMDVSDDILICFNNLIRMCTRLMDRDNIDELFLKEIFTYMLHIGKLLEISEDEVINACYSKIKKNEDRLKSDY